MFLCRCVFAPYTLCVELQMCFVRLWLMSYIYIFFIMFADYRTIHCHEENNKFQLKKQVFYYTGFSHESCLSCYQMETRILLTVVMCTVVVCDKNVLEFHSQ